MRNKPYPDTPGTSRAPKRREKLRGHLTVLINEHGTYERALVSINENACRSQEEFLDLLELPLREQETQAAILEQQGLADLEADLEDLGDLASWKQLALTNPKEFKKRLDAKVSGVKSHVRSLCSLPARRGAPSRTAERNRRIYELWVRGRVEHPDGYGYEALGAEVREELGEKLTRTALEKVVERERNSQVDLLEYVLILVGRELRFRDLPTSHMVH